jgi:hypothetical protein
MAKVSKSFYGRFDTPEAAAARIGRIARQNRRTAALKRPVEDPSTANRQYTAEEFDFLRRCDAYRERYDRRFLNACDYLHIIKAMGYLPPPPPGG